ncbi:hypothetical protein N7465_009660 [Penicillium sp. CMV-2018d]|nr:hypothetical protein N7465_009660 [Penicillium sp. CMV-2018d]
MTPLWCKLRGLGLLLICIPFVTASPHEHIAAHQRVHYRRDVVSSTTSPEAAPTVAHGYMLLAETTTVSGPTAFFNISDLTMFSSDCATALADTVDCSDTIRYAEFQSGLTPENLTALCTTACFDSITTFRSKVLKSCASDVYTDEPSNDTSYVYGTGAKDDMHNVEGISIKPIGLIDPFFVNYNVTCMQDNANPPAFCYLSAVNSTTDEIEDDPCGNCGLGIMRAQLDNAVGYIDQLASQYLSSASSCGVTVPPLSEPTPVYLSDPNTVVSSASTSLKCTGSYVPVPTGTTCDEFAEANSISTDQLLMINGLVGGCVNWPGSLTNLCVQGTCEPYLVQRNDTCAGIAGAHNITITQLLSWNPTIDPVCANWPTKIGHVICVGNNVGYIEPTTSYEASSTATAVSIPTNAVDGSNTNCSKWYSVLDDDNCASISVQNGISLEDLEFLNPELNTNCTNLFLGYSYCVQAVGDISTYSGYATATTSSAIFVPNPSITWTDLPTATRPIYNFTTTTSSYPLASGSLDKCFESFNNDMGALGCYEAATMFGVSVTNFLLWNPSILNGEDYTIYNCKLTNETRYCGSFYNQTLAATTTMAWAPVPTDATLNATTECLDWYDTIEGDDCDSICKIFDISFSSMYEWNPSIGPDCTNLWMNTPYCVMGQGWSTVSYNMSTTSASISTTPSTGGAPAPTQSGIVANCEEWYVAQKDDSCAAIASKYSITVAQFNAWNPAVGDDCVGLWADEAYCVKASTAAITTSPTVMTSSTQATVTPPAPTQAGIISSCNAYDVAQDGDGCEVFAIRNKITVDQLYNWNTALNNACENFWLNEAYCIGVRS